MVRDDFGVLLGGQRMEVGALEVPAPALPKPWLEDPQREEATILALVDVVLRAADCRALAPRCLAREDCGATLGADPRQRPIHHGDVHELTLAGLLPGDDGRENADAGEHRAATQVGDVD